MNHGALFLASLAATLFLTGLAWHIQVVQLPLMQAADAARARELRRRNTLLMAIPMLVELVTAAWLWVAFSPVLVVWAATLLYTWQFAKLIYGFNAAVMRTLVGIHAIRTAAWTLRGGMMLWIAREHLHIQ